MVQDLRSHFVYYFSENNEVLKNRFYKRVLYIELNEIIKGVLLACGIFKNGKGLFLYENLKQDIHLKICEMVTIKTLTSIKNINGYIFLFAKNHCLNELERQNKLDRIKQLIKEYQ